MKIQTTIKVGNNSELGVDEVAASTNCAAFLTLRIPAQVAGKDIDLSVDQLREFILRTAPSFITQENVGRSLPK